MYRQALYSHLTAQTTLLLYLNRWKSFKSKNKYHSCMLGSDGEMWSSAEMRRLVKTFNQFPWAGFSYKNLSHMKDTYMQAAM